MSSQQRAQSICKEKPSITMKTAEKKEPQWQDMKMICADKVSQS